MSEGHHHPQGQFDSFLEELISPEKVEDDIDEQEKREKEQTAISQIPTYFASLNARENGQIPLGAYFAYVLHTRRVVKRGVRAEHEAQNASSHDARAHEVVLALLQHFLIVAQLSDRSARVISAAAVPRGCGCSHARL